MDTNHFKERLQKELETVEDELKTVGRRNPSNPADWQATPGDVDASATERDEVADKIEQFEENTAILKELEIRYNSIKRALGKIADGTYGICEISGHPIEEERLEANPAARTCEAHMDQEGSLA